MRAVLPLTGPVIRAATRPLLLMASFACPSPSFPNPIPTADVAAAQAARSALIDALHRCPRLQPVRTLHADLQRYDDKDAFRAFVTARFGLGSLVTQGEYTAVRRVVHTHLLLSPHASSTHYKSLIERLETLEDPSAPLGPSTESEEPRRFPVDPAKLYTSSQSYNHLAFAQRGMKSTEKAVAQVEGSIQALRDKAADGDPAHEAALRDREIRLTQLRARLEKFVQLVEVLEEVERAIQSKTGEVTEVMRHSATEERGPSWGTVQGKAVEKRAANILQECISTLGIEGLQLMTGVYIQSLEQPEMAEIRQDVVSRRLEFATDNPKGEIDALVVMPSSTDPKRLQVVLAVEMKRSLDEVAVDCFKFGLLLDVCCEASRRGMSHLIRFSLSSAHGQDKRPESTETSISAIGTNASYVLDFSTLPPSLCEMAVYMAQKGTVLRPVPQLIMEAVKLLENGDDDCVDRILRFYAPDFDGGTPETLSVRESVIDELYSRFEARGREVCRRRIEALHSVLCGSASVDRDSVDVEYQLMNVFRMVQAE